MDYRTQLIPKPSADKQSESGMKNAPFLKRFGNATSGLLHAVKNEPSFKFQLVAALAACFVLIIFNASPVWWAIFSLSISMVLAAELFNTALESTLDRVHPNIHPQIKAAKDCAAGAVLVFSCGALLVFLSFCLNLWSSH